MLGPEDKEGSFSFPACGNPVVSAADDVRNDAYDRPAGDVDSAFSRVNLGHFFRCQCFNPVHFLILLHCVRFLFFAAPALVLAPVDTHCRRGLAAN